MNSIKNELKNTKSVGIEKILFIELWALINHPGVIAIKEVVDEYIVEKN